MAEIIPFKRPKASVKHQGKTLCKSGFHKWAVESNKRFDVRLGKLITSYVCTRCGAKKNEAL
jgi:hypothetical protein